MLSQAKQKPPFPIENPSLGAGRSPLLMSVPVAYYTTFFRPQLWGFFVFDFERGFSFYWCAKVFGLLFASGWCLHQLGVRSPGLVVFGAVWIFFSSFTQWWFSSPAMLPEMVASWAMCLGCAVCFQRRSTPWRVVAALAGLIFFAVNFFLCLYPPYQIPLLLLAAAILVGVYWERRADPEEGSVSVRRSVALIGLGLAAAGFLLIPFLIDVWPTLALVRQTVYPGARRSLGGELSVFKLFSGLVGFFEAEQVGPRVYGNIAEASNFYPLWPLPAVALLIAFLHGRIRLSPLMIALGIILVSLSLYCVVPWPSWLLNVTLLSFSTERRTLLALGLANIFFCCLFFDRYREPILRKWSALAAGIACWLAMAAIFWSFSLRDPTFFSDPLRLLSVLVINTAILVLFFWERLRKSLPAVLSALVVISGAGINPIMTSLAPLVDSEAFKSIERLHKADPDGKWMVFQSRYFAQLVKATGAEVFNGTKIIPDLPLLLQLDSGGQNAFTYNRYANISCELPREGRGQSVDGGLIHPDLYVLFLSPAQPSLQKAGYRYVVFPRVWPDATSYGFSLIEQIPQGALWIYRSGNSSANRLPLSAQRPM